jgi:gamma-glutamylcyclotransferase (GGCT)/AIG2-like uncharacterized protein YtfP
MRRIFVYGTLKRGFCRHDALSNQTFLGIAITKPNYKLFDLGSYPGLVFAEQGKSIQGELYDVDDDCLRKLDVIEGVSVGLYRRDPIQLLSPWNLEPVETYIYLSPIDDSVEISNWSSH